MKDRIRKIRKDFGLTQKEFADRLGIKQNTVATYEIGKTNVGEAVITSICREFNVNEEWLRYGTGEMYRKKDTAFSELIAEIDYSDDEFLKNIITAYMGLDEDSKQALRKIAKSMAEKYKGQS